MIYRILDVQGNEFSYDTNMGFVVAVPATGNLVQIFKSTKIIDIGTRVSEDDVKLVAIIPMTNVARITLEESSLVVPTASATVVDPRPAPGPETQPPGVTIN